MKPLAARLTKTILKQLRTRKVTNAEAAAKLGVSETYLSRTVAALQTKEPGKNKLERAARTKLFRARRETRANLAKAVLAGTHTLPKACKAANCSERTMMRWMAKYRKPAKQGRKA